MSKDLLIPKKFLNANPATSDKGIAKNVHILNGTNPIERSWPITPIKQNIDQENANASQKFLFSNRFL